MNDDPRETGGTTRFVIPVDRIPVPRGGGVANQVGPTGRNLITLGIPGIRMGRLGPFETGLTGGKRLT